MLLVRIGIRWLYVQLGCCVCSLPVLLCQVLRENELLLREVEMKESKLSSSMNSIKTFWSPELKKERALRKDEVSKISVWKEQYRIVQDETQVCLVALLDLMFRQGILPYDC